MKSIFFNRTIFNLFLISLLFYLSLQLLGCASDPITAPVTQRQPELTKKARDYRVSKGDTLFSIAWQSGHDFKTVARWNALAPPYTIYPGQRINFFANKKTINKPRYKNTKQSESRKKNIKAQKKQPSRRILKKPLKVRWLWPLRGAVERKFSKGTAGRNGIDITAKKHAVVKAAADGKVVYSGNGLIGYGNLLIIKHNDNYLSAYGYNRRLLAKEGDFVKAGEKIAEAGLIGRRRMLHFEIRRKGKPVDPLRYLPVR